MDLSSARAISVKPSLGRESLDIRERLAKADPTNSQWQRDLAISYNKLGDLSSTRGDLGEAERLMGESLKIFERLAKTDPTNSQWQRDLAISYNKLRDLSSTRAWYLAKPNASWRKPQDCNARPR